MKILFITFSKRPPELIHLDQSVIYRCFNPAFGLMKRGVEVEVVHCKNLSTVNTMPDIVVCHRPVAGSDLEVIVRRFSGHSRLVADYDDLLFCTQTLDLHPAQLSGRMSLAKLQVSAESYSRALQYFSEFIVSTEPLKEQLHVLKPHAQINVLNNGWGDDWRAFSDLAPVKKPAVKKICYFAGTANHDQDLYSISEQLRCFLEENPDVMLEVYSAIDLSIFSSVKSQVKSGKPFPFYLFPQLIQQAWVTLAPLVTSPFNHCKSAIKFVESGLFGVPLIASKTQDLTRMSNSGLLFADHSEQWFTALNSLKDSDFYKQSSSAARLGAIEQSASSALQRSTLLEAWNV